MSRGSASKSGEADHVRKTVEVLADVKDTRTMGAGRNGPEAEQIGIGQNLPYAALQPETYDPHSKGSDAAAEGQGRFAQCSPNRRLGRRILEFPPGFSF